MCTAADHCGWDSYRIDVLKSLRSMTAAGLPSGRGSHDALAVEAVRCFGRPPAPLRGCCGLPQDNTGRHDIAEPVNA